MPMLYKACLCHIEPMLHTFYKDNYKVKFSMLDVLRLKDKTILMTIATE